MAGLSGDLSGALRVELAFREARSRQSVRTASGGGNTTGGIISHSGVPYTWRAAMHVSQLQALGFDPL